MFINSSSTYLDYMEYNLNHPKRKEIFKQFLKHEKLKFNELEKLSGLRSNELAYFLEKLSNEGIIKKEMEHYSLSDNAEKYIPFFIEDSRKLGVLPVILVACVRDGKILLMKRKKRPYLGLWGLVGGRLLLNETIKEGVLRLTKEKASVKGNFSCINGVLHEKYSLEEDVKHSYLLILTTVNSDDVKEHEGKKWFDLNNLEKSEIIPSDLWLIKNMLDKKTEISEEVLSSKDGKLEINFLKN